MKTDTYHFLFDLDSTVTRCELLPLLAKEIGMEEMLQRQTEACMRGTGDFAADFSARAMLLKEIPLHRAREIVAQAPLHTEIYAFLCDHRQRCTIVSGNLDVWIVGLIERIGMQGRCACSRAYAEGDHLIGISAVLDKGAYARSLSHPFAAVGDGDNDAEMLAAADCAIAFSGARPAAPRLLRLADHHFPDEAALCRFLGTLA